MILLTPEEIDVDAICIIHKYTIIDDVYITTVNIVIFSIHIGDVITVSGNDIVLMMTSSNGNIFRVTGHLCGEFTGPR